MKKFLLGVALGALFAGGLVSLISHRYSVVVVSNQIIPESLCRVDHWTGRTWVALWNVRQQPDGWQPVSETTEWDEKMRSRIHFSPARGTDSGIRQ